MKRLYITPGVGTHQIGCQEMLSSVSEAISSNKGIGYGGVDEAGELAPGARERGTFGPTEEEAVGNQQMWEQGLW